MARIVAIQELVQVLRNDLLNPKEQSARLARIAKDKLAEVEAKQGKFPTVVKVDGREGGREEEVKPDGTIVYLIHPFVNFIDELVAEIIRRSPVGPAKEGSGYRGMHFKDMWKVMVNGAVVETHTGLDPRPGDEWVFVNTMPYARRLAWGWSAQAPALWLDDIARDFQRKYGNLFGGVKLKGGNLKGFEYTFIVPPLEIMPPEDHQFSDHAKRYNRHLRYPAIIVRIPGNALTT